MMTPGHRRGPLGVVQAVAALVRFSLKQDRTGFGVNLSLRSVSRQENRWRDVGVQIDFQLRSGTRAVVTDTEVRYDLDVQAYNDLHNENGRCPRLLVVFIMPTEEARWLSQTRRSWFCGTVRTGFR